MSPVQARRVMCLAWMSGLTGVGACCGPVSCCNLPDSRTYLVEAGLYAGATEVADESSFPQAGGSGFRMEVDRSARRVRVRYDRGGQMVEDFWRVTASDTVPCWECPP